MATVWPGPDALKDFRESGFLALPRLVGEAELEWLRAVYDRLFENLGSVDPGDYYDIAGEKRGRPVLPQIIRPERYSPELLESDHFGRCRALAAAFLDTPEGELDFYGHAILKPAAYGAETPWHQDEAYMSPLWHRRGLSVWTALDDATVESGCLHFLPGMHEGSVLPHHHIDDDDRIRGLVTDAVDARSAVARPLAPGEASLHDFRTPHYAGPNITASQRRAYVLVFMGPATPVENPVPRPWLNEG